MKLRVKTTGNYAFEIGVESDDTVADVKRNIENSQGTDFYAADRLVVVHAGKILKGETTLKENGVTEKSLMVIFTSSEKRGSEGDSSGASTSPAEKFQLATDAGASSTGQSTDSAVQTTQPTEPASTVPTVAPLKDFQSSTTVADVSTHPCEPPSSPRDAVSKSKQSGLDEILKSVTEELERSEEDADSTPAVARSKQLETIDDVIKRMSQGPPSSQEGASRSDGRYLPVELVANIGCKIKIYEEYVRFRALSRPLLHTVPRIPNHLPWLLVSFEEPAFFNPEAGCLYSLRCPPNSLDFAGRFCCGSSCGWLVMIGDDYPGLHVVNPLTRAVVHLPPPITVGAYNLQPVRGLGLFCDPTRLLDEHIVKIILSAAPSIDCSFSAVAIFKDGQVELYHNGNWSSVDGAYEFTMDVVYADDCFFALRRNGNIAVIRPSPDGFDLTFIYASFDAEGDSVGLYLAKAGGDLLVASMSLQLSGRCISCMAGFEVRKLQGTSWVQTKKLEKDHVLYLGRNASVTIQASPGCGNQIYFAKRSLRGVYSLDRGYSEPFPDIRGRFDLYGEPLWVTRDPNPL